MVERIPLAKITRPRLSGIASRERVFQLLDEGMQKPVTWVASTAGSGKTTMIASWIDSRKLPCLWYQIDEGDGDLATFFYHMGLAAKKAAPRYKKPLPLLTPEYLQGIPTFTRRYFEKLFSRLTAPFIIVLDNYQDAPLQSGLHDMIAIALDAIPEGIHVIAISRAESPSQLSRLRASNKMQHLGWNEIRFTLDESMDFINAHGVKLSEEAQQHLYKKTEGWASGLVLMMENAHKSGFETAPALNSQREVFDYFANEIFNRSDKVIQTVLLKTAFLPRIDPAVAKKLTSIDSAPQILDRLSRQNYFTQWYLQGYQYHPLFREFLLMRAANTFPQAELSLIQRKAAESLKESGQIEDAAQLFHDASDWNGLAMLISSQAQALVSQGRSKTLEEWISYIPKEITEDSPWLIYWFGSCRMAFNPIESRARFEKAFELFKAGNDTSGILLSWSNIVDTFGYEWENFAPVDRWIEVIEELLSGNLEYPSPEIEARVAAGIFNAMTWRKPLHPDLPIWADKVMLTVLNSQNIQLRMLLGSNLLYYYLWSDDSAKASVIINTLKPFSRVSVNDPLTQEMWYVMEAMYAWLLSDHDACVTAVSEGIKLAERTGVHLVKSLLISMGIESSLSAGNHDEATGCLKEIAALNMTRLLDRAQYQHLLSSVAWVKGDYHNALRHGENAVKLAEETGYYLARSSMEEAQAVLLFDMGRHAEAAEYLDRAIISGRGISRMEFCCQIQKARFAFEAGNNEGLDFLRTAMSIGAKHGYFNFIRWSPEVMARLCVKALEHGIEVQYVQHLIKIRSLVPPDGTVENWPYPVKIYTLGKFEIVKDSKPVEFSGKVQKKPLEILKLLIDCGGQTLEGHIVDTLWPEAEGDMAHNSFKMALSRLRNLIGKESIKNQDGKISLNPSFCWVDALAARPVAP